MACGSNALIEGGVLKDATAINTTITNSKVSDSTITASTIDGARLTNLIEIDSVSAGALVAAISALPPDAVRRLAEALFRALNVDVAAPPETTEEDAIPTTMYGDRNALLGAPLVWGKMNGMSVPLYKTN